MPGFFETPEPETTAPAPKPKETRRETGYMDRMLAARRRRISGITGESPAGYRVRARWNV